MNQLMRLPNASTRRPSARTGLALAIVAPALLAAGAALAQVGSATIQNTAHNLSAGGPIIQPGVDAIVLTPLCPHSLTHKPLVIERDSVIDIVAGDVNPGTTAIIDGQVSCPLHPGDLVTLRRFETDFLLVHNPHYSKWHNLVTKLHWGQAPGYD